MEEGGGGIEGVDRGGRRFGVAGVAGVGADQHHHVVHGFHRAQGGFEGGLQRHAQHAQFDGGDLHAAVLARRRWMLVMRSM